MAYNHHKNAWFEIDVSLYYMNLLFSYLPWIPTLFLILQIFSVIWRNLRSGGLRIFSD